MNLEKILQFLNFHIERDALKCDKTQVDNPMINIRKHFKNYREKILFKRKRTNSTKGKIMFEYYESYIYLSDDEELVICQVDKLDSLQPCQLLVRDITFYLQGCMDFNPEYNYLFENFYKLCT